MSAAARQQRAGLEERVLGAYLADPHKILRAAGPAWGLELFRERRSMASAVFELAPDLDAISEALRLAGSTDAAPGLVLDLPDADVTALVDLHTRDLDEKKDRAAGFTLGDRWCSFSAADLAKEPPEKQFLWQDRIPLGDVGSLAAGGASGKTSLIVGLAIHRAIGRPFLGRSVRQGSTVIVTTEDGREDYCRKIAAWRSVTVELDLTAVAKHVHLIDLAGIPFRLIKSDFGDYVPTAHIEELARVVKARDPSTELIVIETVSRVGGDEGNAAMSALVCAAEQLAKLTGATVLLVSHVSKAAGREKNGDAYSARGGSALGDNGRFSLTLAGLLEEQQEHLLGGVHVSPEAARDLLVLRVPKINSAPVQEPVVLQRVGTRYGLTLREYLGAGFGTADEAKAVARASLGQSLRAMAEKCQRLAEPLTESKLNTGLFKDIPGLSKQRIPATVLNAIEDGFLVRGPPGQGGGKGCLLPNTPGPTGAPGEFLGESWAEASK